MATKVLQYVKGTQGNEYVPNAQGYELWKGTVQDNKFVPSGDAPLATQIINQQLVIPGAIGENGRLAEYNQLLSSGAKKSVTPITELTETGYKYYIRFSGLLDITSEYGPLTGVSFGGRLYLSSASVISDLSIPAAGSQQFRLDKDNTDESKRGIYLITSAGDVKVLDKYDFTGPIGLVLDGNAVTVHSAHESYRRTDFIKISDLTDNLMILPVISGQVPEFACVGPFTPKSNDIEAYKIAFYDSMNYSSFKGGMKWDDFQTNYVKLEELIGYRDGDSEFAGVAPGAEYVIFSSSIVNYGTNEGEDDAIPGERRGDFVSVGGINFLLTGNEAFKSGDILAVKAKGDGTFFSDSAFSNAVTYTPVT